MEIMQEEKVQTEIVPQEVRPPTIKLTAAEIKADVQLIQQVIRALFKPDVHFGVIPGTKKKTLYKAGAEKIMVIFRLCGEPLIEDLSVAGEIRYRIRFKITHQVTGLIIGWGVGECSSNEEKYKWKKAVLAEYNATAEDQRRLKYYADSKPVTQVRVNIADVANTILKMCKKRALIDATLTCTAASDVFDQDFEDLPPELRQNVADKAPMPQRASEKPKPAPVEDSNDSTEDPPPPARMAIDLSKARSLAAKFDAPCKLCGAMISTGEQMKYLGEGHDKGRYCATRHG